jgi:hypothetical protein
MGESGPRECPHMGVIQCGVGQQIGVVLSLLAVTVASGRYYMHFAQVRGRAEMRCRAGQSHQV